MGQFLLLFFYFFKVDTKKITFKNLINSIGKDKPGYEKIWFCGE